MTSPIEHDIDLDALAELFAEVDEQTAAEDADAADSA